jgi:uncharacterized membrane protein YgcG
MNALLLASLLLCAAPAQETVRYPAKPGPREFILDEAKLLTPEDAAEIKTLCEEALTRKRAPIIVVTIPSLASYGAAGWPIERYAMNLMSEWGVGWEDWNYGMLLLVSPGDRKARIELGGNWARRKDDEARRIMSQKIIPKFKTGDYSKGILEGVRGLHRITLDAVPSRSGSQAPPAESPSNAPAPVPTPGQPLSDDSGRGFNPGGGCLPVGGLGLIVVVVVGIVIVKLVSRLFRGGASSWGNNGPGYYGGGGYYNRGGGGFGSSLGGGILGGALGSMIGNSISNRGRHSSSSGYSSPSSPPSSGGGSDSSFGGGSFGGGFSGGGGASGEW